MHLVYEAKILRNEESTNQHRRIDENLIMLVICDKLDCSMPMLTLVAIIKGKKSDMIC